MNVLHLVYAADSLTYTVAKALSVGGHQVCVWNADREFERRPQGGIQRNLRGTPGVTLVAHEASALPESIERLIIQVFPRPSESLACVDALASRARAITLISAGDRSRSWRDALKLQWRELGALARNARKVDRVLFKDGFHRRDLFAVLARQQVLGFDVHSQFLHNEDLFEAMHARDWVVDEQRPILVNFLGSQDPDSRKRILDAVRPQFLAADGAAVGAGNGKAMFWHEYSDASPVGLDPAEFVRKLTASDFTLCPRGYSLVTHRPIEALLRGSIPVLAAKETDLYGIDLVPGQNCIAVDDDGWADTLRRLASIDDAEIVRMRRNIAGMFDDALSYDAMAKRMRARLGVTDA